MRASWSAVISDKNGEWRRGNATAGEVKAFKAFSGKSFIPELILELRLFSIVILCLRFPAAEK